MRGFSFYKGPLAALWGFSLFLVWMVLCVPAAGFANPVEIEIAQVSQVTGDQLVLSDIASFAAEDFLEKAIGDIPLGSSPKPGQIRKFEKNRLIRLIQANRLINGTAKITCPDQVYIKRNAQKLDHDFIQDRVIQYLEDRFSPRSFEIITMNIRGTENYPEGELQLVPGSRCFIGNNGRLSLSMNVLVDDVQQGRISVTGRVAEFDTLVCAARYIEKGTVLTAQDICLEKKDVMKLRTRGIKHQQDAIGQTMTFSVQKGQILDPAKLSPTSLVKKGDVVTLVAAKNNLRIITAGISIEDGFVNQPIQVENIRSGKKVRGILRNNSTVEVIY